MSHSDQAQHSNLMYWKFGLYAASCVYLIFELAFNGVLTFVAGSGYADKADLDQVETFGRLISSVGISLLIADLFSKKSTIENPRKALVYLCMVTSVVAPTSYYGQKILIDSLFIIPSSSEARQDAYYSQIIKASLASGVIEIEGLPFGQNKDDIPLERTFLSLFGGMLFLNDELLKHIKSNGAAIARNYVTKRSMDRFDEDYSEYKAFKEDLHQKFDTYKKDSIAYWDTRKSVSGKLAELNKRIIKDQDKGWANYQSGVERFRNTSEKKAKVLAPKLHKYFTDREKCKSDRCRNRYDKGYLKEAKKHGFNNVPSKYWLVEKEVSTAEQAAWTTATAVVTGGLSLAISGLSMLLGGDAVTKPSEYYSTSDVDHYTKRIMQHKSQAFKDKSGGYEHDINSRIQFNMHPATSKNTVTSLKKQGLNVPSSWKIGDDQALGKALSKKINKDTDSKWKASIKSMGLEGLPPGLDFDRFQRSKQIQNEIQKTMGDYYVKPTLATWNNKQFLKRVVNINIERNVKKIQKKIQSSTKSFGDGQPLATEGKDALRALLIPLIAMIISLALSIMTFGKLIAIPLQFILFGGNSSNSNFSILASTLQGGFRLSVICLVLYLPFALNGNVYSDNSTAVSALFKKLEVSTNSVMTLPLKWLLVVQPLIQPVGHSLNNTLGILSIKENIEFKSTEIQDLLAEADLAIKEHRYMTPKQFAAVPKLEKVLKIEPNNSQAIDRLKTIKEIYKRKTRNATKANKQKLNDYIWRIDRSI